MSEELGCDERNQAWFEAARRLAAGDESELHVEFWHRDRKPILGCSDAGGSTHPYTDYATTVAEWKGRISDQVWPEDTGVDINQYIRMKEFFSLLVLVDEYGEKAVIPFPIVLEADELLALRLVVLAKIDT
jgi:hypothetical protein